MENVEGQDLLDCPYDKSHHILRSRMQVHLTRCRRNYPKVNKVTCPFNVTHVLNGPELDFHVSVCPDRQTFENFRHAPVPVTSPTMPPQMSNVQSDENWDDDPAVSSYQPQAYASNANILRSLQGAPPSKRKEFRKQERYRLMGIDN